MAEYLEITSKTGGSRNRGLKRAITHLGKHYGKLANMVEHTTVTEP